jgi:hypothetical protein
LKVRGYNLVSNKEAKVAARKDGKEKRGEINLLARYTIY